MTRPGYCSCERPLIDVEHDAGCRRCGLPVDFTPPPESFAVRPGDTLESWNARRQELLDRQAETSPPAWGEAGSIDARLAATLAAVAAAVLVVAFAWHYLLAGGVLYAAYRHLTRQTRRRRPRSSFASNAKAVAALYAAWNTRGLVQRGGRPLRVSVPAAAGAEHVDEYGEVPF